MGRFIMNLHIKMLRMEQQGSEKSLKQAVVASQRLKMPFKCRAVILNECQAALVLLHTLNFTSDGVIRWKMEI